MLFGIHILTIFTHPTHPIARNEKSIPIFYSFLNKGFE